MGPVLEWESRKGKNPVVAVGDQGGVGSTFLSETLLNEPPTRAIDGTLVQEVPSFGCAIKKIRPSNAWS